MAIGGEKPLWLFEEEINRMKGEHSIKIEEFDNEFKTKNGKNAEVVVFRMEGPEVRGFFRMFAFKWNSACKFEPSNGLVLRAEGRSGGILYVTPDVPEEAVN